MTMQPIETAPKDGTMIRIRGKRFMTGTVYHATAVWAERACPAKVVGWFPPVVDRQGPYLNVTHWSPA